MAQALAPDAFKGAMLKRLEGRRHWEQPIVKQIAAGTATPEQIGYLGVLFYHFTRHTPQVLSTIHSRCSDRKIRRRIMDVLIDEDTELRCGSAGHDVLAMDFATRFTGLSEDEVEGHPVPEKLDKMIEYRYDVARNLPIPIALGNSGIAGESHFAGACRLISDGLREHYGVRDEDQESWIVHIEGDEEHGNNAFAAVCAYATTPELQDKMFWCIDNYLLHWNNFWTESGKGALLRFPRNQAAE
jgi:pyrroloquinoline quinone (PQQ) biosynthesis protein C